MSGGTDGPALTKAAVYARTALEDACRIIELGDERLLASDGPAGGRPPELSLAEWRTLYVTLDKARKRLWSVAEITAGRGSPDGPDNDGTEWVCSACGSTVTGPSRAPMCPKGCHLMDRAWIETMRGDEERNGTPDMDGRYPSRGSPDGGDLPAPRVERHPDWEGGWVLHFKTYSVAVAQLEREQRRDAAYAEAARDPAFCADMKALTHGVGALPAPREPSLRDFYNGDYAATADELRWIEAALGASRSGGGSPHAADCSAVIFAPGAKGQGWEPACDCGAGTPPLEGSRE